MLFVVLKHYTVAAKINFRKAVMNLDEPRGKNVRENVGKPWVQSRGEAKAHQQHAWRHVLTQD